MKIFSFYIAFLLVLVTSCNEIDPKSEKDIRDFVVNWSNTHTLIKAPYLQEDYMDVVNYYGNKRTKRQVQQDKLLLFEQFPDYTQQIASETIAITLEGASYIVTFTTKVRYNGIEQEFPTFLSVIEKNGVFKILREGITESATNLNAPILPKFRENNKSIIKKRRLYGDFNGDGLSDYAYIVAPTSNNRKQNETSNQVECEDACESTIYFSLKSLPSILVQNSYASELENLKDLNGDGADEIGFWDLKPTSKTLYIFNPVNSELLTNPVYINTAQHKNLKLIDVFKKTGPNKITVTRSEQVNGRWKLVSTVVDLN